MSSYKVVLKPGGVGGRNVGVGIKLAKKPLLSPEEIAALSAVVPVSTSLEVTVIYPVGMIGASVRITGPDAFDQTIVNTMMFDAIAAGDYIIVAAAVAGHTVRVFTSPKSVPQGRKTCAMVIYDLAGTGGGGGNCTPACDTGTDLRWIPPGTVPSPDPYADFILEANEIVNLPNALFTTDLSSIAGVTYPMANNVSEIFYGRYFGTVCPGDILNWEVQGIDFSGDFQASGSYAGATLPTFYTFGNTIVVQSNSILISGVAPTPGSDFGNFAVRLKHWHLNSVGVYEEVCFEQISSTLFIVKD